MRRRPRLTPRLASLSLAALGLMLPARADAASKMSVVDLGAGVSGLVLGESGQVAGLIGPNPALTSDPDSFRPGVATNPFEYDHGRFTSLASGIVPVAVANDGRVIDARGPTDFFTGYGSPPETFYVGLYATAGNHLGELVGTATNYPYGSTGYSSDPALYRAAARTPYLYVPDTPGLPASTQAAANNPNPNPYRIGGYDGPVLGFGRPEPPEPGTMYTQYTSSHEETSGPHPMGINDRGLIVGDIYTDSI